MKTQFELGGKQGREREAAPPGGKGLGLQPSHRRELRPAQPAALLLPHQLHLTPPDAHPRPASMPCRNCGIVPPFPKQGKGIRMDAAERSQHHRFANAHTSDTS